MALAHFSLIFLSKQKHHLVQRSLVMCSVLWNRFGFLLVIYFAVITGSSVPLILGGDTNHLLTALSPVPGELALAG